MTDAVRTSWCRIDGRRVRALAAGTGPPVAIVPGLGLSADFYRPNLRALAAVGLGPMAVDLPGFGRSDPAGWSGLTPGATAAWLERFACETELPAAAWVGHSVSCQAVIELAVRAPDRVRALVIAAPTGVRRRARAAAQAAMLALDATREPLDTLAAVARDYLRVSPLRYGGTWLRASRHEPMALAPRVSCPCLVLTGERDPVARPALAERLVRALPGGRLEIIGGGAHALPRDRAGAFDREVGRFLASLP